MSLKSFAIETLEIAEWNVLKAIFRLRPQDFDARIAPNYNNIRWILRHLALQMDYSSNYLCQEKKIVHERPLHSLSIKDLIDAFLQVSEATFAYLDTLPAEKFMELPEHNELDAQKHWNTETVGELIQRIALHFLGHTGQIIWIKKHLSKGGSFVMGFKKGLRGESRKKWMNWWPENKEKYSAS